MNALNKTLLAAAAITLISGCNTESGFRMPTYSLDGVTLKTPTLNITEADAGSLARAGLDVDALSDEYATYRPGTAARNSLYSRETQRATENCPDSGSVTVTVSSNSINSQSGTMDADGSMAVASQFDNCVNGPETLNGGLGLDMAWQGYNEAAGSIDEVRLRLLFDSLSYIDSSWDPAVSEQIHGGIVVTTDGMTAKLTFKLSVASSESTYGETIAMTTTEAIVYDSYGTPQSGAWTIWGANDNRVDAYLNAGQLCYQFNLGTVSCDTI